MKINKDILVICILLVAMAGILGCGIGNNSHKVQITCSVKEDMGFGSTQLLVSPIEFIEAGFEYGDSCSIDFTNGRHYENIPFYNGYYGKTGELAIVAYPGYEFDVFARCQGASTWDEAGFTEEDQATITLSEKGRFKNVQDALGMTYTNKREEYLGDEEFANFRVMNGGLLKPDMFYRGASPFDNQYNRAQYANDLIEKNGVKYILDLADTADKINGYREKADYKSDYAAFLYDEDNVYVAGLSASYRSDDYRQKTVAMLKEMTKHQGPYYIHCTEGKDRTGFVCMLLECMAEWSYDDIKADYMKTYENYYGITETNETDKYNSVVDVKFNDMILWLVGVDKKEDVTSKKLVQGAHDYLVNSGMNEEEYQKLQETITVP